MLIADGIDPVTVAKRLGHATPAITLNIYSHQIKRTDREAAERLGNLFSPKESEASPN